jgi:hypothetical protein
MLAANCEGNGVVINARAILLHRRHATPAKVRVAA